MEQLKSIFASIIRVWRFICTYLSLSWQWLVGQFGKILTILLGKERIIAFQNKINSYKGTIRSNIDTEGKYYPFVKKLYKYFSYALVGGLFYVFCLETNFLWLTGNMPSVQQLANPKVAQASTIMTADGVPIGKFFAENRTTVDSSQISPWIFKALIATEDARFYQHSGIDLKSLGGVAAGLLTGGERGGGSTISQQLAKNLYNTRKREMRGVLSYIPFIKTIVYKTKEWLTAISLERNFTKGEILTMYLNTVDYGNNAYGIKTAARTYFDKEPEDLSIEESAVLVGLQKGTTLYNPIRNPKNALNRRNTVLQLMAKKGYISPAKAAALEKKEIFLDENFEDDSDGQGSYFKVALARFVEKWANDNDIDIDLYRDGLKIYTSIDSRMQTHAEVAVAEKMKALQKAFDVQWGKKNPWAYEDGTEIPGFIDTVAKRTTYYKSLTQKFKKAPDSVKFYMEKKHKMMVFDWNGEKEVNFSAIDSIAYYKKFLQCGMMAMDPYSGFIKAWVGGINYDYFKYDHVKQGRRQPGSSFKPILYCSAMDGPLNLSPCDSRADKPFKAEWVENGEAKTWEPKNANGKFTYAMLTLRKAIARSVNSVAAQLTSEVKPKMVIEYARKLGITSPLDPVMSIGLGSSEVSLYEMVAAYGTFVNKGIYTEPMLVFKIEDAKGKILFEFEPKKHQAIKEESAFLMQYLLRGGVEESGGTAQGLHSYNVFENGSQIGGKTGTTSNYSDAWYIGFTKDLVCGIWVGGDDRSIHFRGSMGEGGHSALPIFGRFMEKVYHDKRLDYKLGPFPKPSFTPTKDYQNCVYGSGKIQDNLPANIADSVAAEAPIDTNTRKRFTTPEPMKRKDTTKTEKN